MLEVKVEKDGEIEFLPYPEILNLGLAEFGFTAAEERNYRLYKAIADRENYFQFNEPTAFGSPQYERLDGILYGLLIGYRLNIIENNDEIIVQTQAHKTIMKIQRPKKTEWFKQRRKEVIELKKGLF